MYNVIVQVNKPTSFGVYLLVVAIVIAGWPVSRAYALAPIDQACQYAISPNSPYTFLSHEPAQVLMPSKNTLDAIAVYIKTDIGGTSQVKATFLSATDTSVQTIATKTQTIDSTAQWVTFDFTDVAIPHPYGIIQLTQADSNHAVWYQCPQASYTLGYGITEGSNAGYNYRFAVYAYDASSGSGAAATSSDDSGIASNSGASSATSSGTKPKSGSTALKNATGALTANADSPDTEALLKSLREEQQKSGGGIFSTILFFLARAAIPLILLFLVFCAGLVGLVLFLRSRNKKPAPAATAAAAPPEEKNAKKDSHKS